MTSQATATAAGGAYDDRERRTADRIEREHPRWWVMWGTASRQYWAFPQFNAPRETILSAPGPRELLACMSETWRATASCSTPPSRSHPARPRPPRRKPQ